MDTIVVGVDGSTGGAEAIRWAAAEARLRSFVQLQRGSSLLPVPDLAIRLP
jgi:hypothetical protein